MDNKVFDIIEARCNHEVHVTNVFTHKPLYGLQNTQQIQRAFRYCFLVQLTVSFRLLRNVCPNVIQVTALTQDWSFSLTLWRLTFMWKYSAFQGFPVTEVAILNLKVSTLRPLVLLISEIRIRIIGVIPPIIAPTWYVLLDMWRS